MYASIHAPEAASAAALPALAFDFSPEVEQTSPDTVVISIAPLRSMLGSWPQIASEIARRGHSRKIKAHLGIAANVDTAILLARLCRGVTIAMPGEEAGKLADLPLERLMEHEGQIDSSLLETLQQWGLSTCHDLINLPANDLRERLGMAGIHLRQLALGLRQRPLRLSAGQTSYEEQMELEHPLEQLEPLLFLFGRALGTLSARLRSQSQAVRLLHVRLALQDKREYCCNLEFPVPLDNSHSLLKLLQLHLERHPPGAAVAAFSLKMETTQPRSVQGGLFVPPTPQPDKLQITLARIAKLVGDDNVGTPELLNTYRPDAFRLVAPEVSLTREPQVNQSNRNSLRLSLRLFRPALSATVQLNHLGPSRVFAAGVNGMVVERSGPWESSGEWWSSSAWRHQEWDVALDDGALYRIARQLPSDVWIVSGIYD